MGGRIIAVYSAKGGVGKTTLAVNLAWASAVLNEHRTLVWDLDPQGGASFILGQGPAGKDVRKGIVDKDDLTGLVTHSDFPRLDVLSADPSLRHLDRDFHDLGKRRRLARAAEGLASRYDLVFIDCPPGLTDTSDQILRACDVAVVPVIPSALSQRALDVIREHLARKDGPTVVLAPVFSMVDRRRLLHRSEVDRQPGWPVIPMASAYERVSQERKPIGALLPESALAVQAVTQLWNRLEKTLASAK